MGIEMETTMIKYAEADLPSVASLSIPAKKDHINAEGAVNRSMLLGMISGVAFTLCLANLVAFMVNLILGAAFIVVLMHAQGLEPITAYAMKKLLFMVSHHFRVGAWSGESPDAVSSIRDRNLPVDYQPFEAEVAMIMDVVGELNCEDLQQKSVLPDKRHCKIAQQIRVDEMHVFESGKEQIIQRYQEIRIERIDTVEEHEYTDVETDDEQIWPQENRYLLEKDLGQFSAEDYTNEIDDLYKQAFHGAPRLSDIVW